MVGNLGLNTVADECVCGRGAESVCLVRVPSAAPPRRSTAPPARSVSVWSLFGSHASQRHALAHSSILGAVRRFPCVNIVLVYAAGGPRNIVESTVTRVPLNLHYKGSYWWVSRYRGRRFASAASSSRSRFFRLRFPPSSAETDTLKRV